MDVQATFQKRFTETTDLVRAALAARSSWLNQGDRAGASRVFNAAKSQMGPAHLTEMSGRVTIPAETMSLLLASVDQICVSFGEMFDFQADGIKHNDSDINAACQALPVRLNDELSRIVSLNGSMPAVRLDILYGRAKHIAVNL